MPEVAPHRLVAEALPRDQPREQHHGRGGGKVERDVLRPAAELVGRVREIDVEGQAQEIEEHERLDPETRVVGEAAHERTPIARPIESVPKSVESFHARPASPRPLTGVPPSY